MTIPPPVELIRQNKAFYLGNREPDGRYLAVLLADCAVISGAQKVELQALPDGWMAVSAEADWISPHLQRRRDRRTIEDAFNSIIPLECDLQNQMRYEVYITAFSSSVGVESHGQWILTIGKLPPQEVQDRVAGNEFAVVFKPQLS